MNQKDGKDKNTSTEFSPYGKIESKKNKNVPKPTTFTKDKNNSKK